MNHLAKAFITYYATSEVNNWYVTDACQAPLVTKYPIGGSMKADLKQLQFESFHRQNPQIYKELVRLARIAKDAGMKTMGIRMLWEVTRWNLTVTTRSSDRFKMNDHYHSRYARLIMKEEKDLEGIFKLRIIR